MTDLELLNRIKKMLAITGSYQDDVLSGYIAEVKEYLSSAGVADSIINSTKAVGVIARGVSDLWNLGSGTTTLSPYFKERVIQLAYTEEEPEEGGADV